MPPSVPSSPPKGFKASMRRQRNNLPSDYTGHNLVFVVGCPRSGTTWLQRLLACHPRIRTGQESHLFNGHIGPQLEYWRWYMEPRERSGGVGLACYLTQKEFHEILRAYMMKLLEPMLARVGSQDIFLEKTPNHARFINEILELLPHARFIHVLRDPRDVVASLLSASQSWAANWAPRSPRAAAMKWVGFVRAVREARQNLNASQFLEIRYEQLHKAPVETLERCSSFLELKWSRDEIVESIQRNDARAMATGGGTPLPLYGEIGKRIGPVAVDPKNFVRRAKIGAWKKDLSAWEKFWTWQVARKMMAEVGYRWPKHMELSFRPLGEIIEVARAVLLPGRRPLQRLT